MSIDFNNIVIGIIQKSEMYTKRTYGKFKLFTIKVY